MIMQQVSFAQSTENTKEQDTQTLSARLDSVVTTFQENRHFMGAVLVAKDGQILLKKAYGMADLEWSVPNTTDARFRIGSVTKQFTAAAILQLVEQHKLSLQDKACLYFTGCPKNWQNITIHQLLSHTSGIPSYTADKNFRQPSVLRVPKTPTEILLLSKNKPLDFKPGTQFRYNNSGYIFLGAIIEKVTGEKYADYIQNHIFKPLGMVNSGYDDTKTLLYHRVLGYELCGKIFCNANYIDMSLPFSGGSLYSTVDDLYLWDRALYTNKILTQSFREQMFTAVKNDYGYGWDIKPMFSRIRYGHAGGVNGFSAYIGRFPKDNTVVIVLSNIEEFQAETVAMSLAGTLFNEQVYLPEKIKPITLSPSVLKRYLGTYKSKDFLMHVTAKKNTLLVSLQTPSSRKQLFIEAVPISLTKFYVEKLDGFFSFSSLKNDQFMQIELKQGYLSIVGQRIKEGRDELPEKAYKLSK